MTTVGVVTLNADDLVLATLFERVADSRFRFEQTAGTRKDTSTSVWISGADASTVDAALEDDPSVVRFDKLTDGKGERLYDIDFTSELAVLRELVFQNDGTLLEAYSEGGSWKLHLRFPTRNGLSNAIDDLERYGFGVAIQEIYSLDSPARSSGVTDLTDQQYEAMALALEEGYFEVPRETTLKELATVYGCSHQALSEKLRRATKSLVTQATANNTDG